MRSTRPRYSCCLLVADGQLFWRGVDSIYDDKDENKVAASHYSVCFLVLSKADYPTNFNLCDNCVRQKDWCCHKHGTQATQARQGDLAGVTRARQRQSFWRMHTLCFGITGGKFSHILRFSVGLLVLSISLWDMLLQGDRSSDDEPAPSMSLAVSRMTSKMEKQRQHSNAMWRAHMAKVIVQLPVHPHLHLYLRFCSDMVSV